MVGKIMGFGENVRRGGREVKSLVCRRLAVFWIYVLGVGGGAIPSRANRVCVCRCRGRKTRMSNVRLLLEMSVNGQGVPAIRVGREGLTMRYKAEEGNPRRVLELDRNPRTLVVIIHEEAINHSYLFISIYYYI
jgi:hypothetical protein